MKGWTCKWFVCAAAVCLCAGGGLARPGEATAPGKGLVIIQAAPALLERATPIGVHDIHSTIELSFRLKTGVTPSQLRVVKRYLAAHGIRVTEVSADRTVINTSGRTGAYDHALTVSFTDYKLHGQQFASSPNPPRLPAAVARYVQSVYAPVPVHRVSLPVNSTNPTHPHRTMRGGDAWMPPLVLPPKQGGWELVAPLPYPVEDNCAVTDPFSGKLYSFTGVYDVPGVPADVVMGWDYVYDPSTDSWSRIADYPQRRGLDWPVCGYINGKIYITDGSNVSYEPNTELDIYDIASDTWSTGASFPSTFGAMHDASGVVLNGEFYVIGGSGGGAPSKEVWAYDPGSDSWTRKADYPIRIPGQSCAAVGGTAIYCGGGTGPGRITSSKAYKYDPASNTWTRIPDLLYGNSHMSASGTLSGKFLLQGGVMNRDTLTNQGQVYDTESDSWSTLPNSIVAVSGSASACGFYMVGGSRYSPQSSVQLLPGNSPCVATGPTGTVEGTVTDASDGSPIDDAKIVLSGSPHDFSTSSDSSGEYSITLPTGEYTATTTTFGYDSPSPVSVQVLDGQTTEQNFVLEPEPGAELHGVVHDGSHGYPLYAEIRVTDTATGDRVGDLATSPVDGHYTTTLPSGHTYHMTATPYLPGYAPASATVTLAADTAKSFSLSPDDSCSTPGYRLAGPDGAPGFSEDFDGDSFPPAGWTVAPASSTVMWQLNIAYPRGFKGNYTGGSGRAADADSNAIGSSGPFDTRLISPPIQVADVGVNPVLQYKENFHVLRDTAADLDISIDGGNTWTTVQHQTETCPNAGLYALPGCDETVRMGSYLDGASSFRLRFRYYKLVSIAPDWYWQVDNVRFGTCQTIPGGLAIGTVQDASNGDAIDDALLIAGPQGSQTHSKSIGPHDGAFVLFLPTGDHNLAASAPGYQHRSVASHMGNGEKKAVRFRLPPD